MHLPGYDDWKTTEPTPDPECVSCGDYQSCPQCSGFGCDECHGTGACMACLPDDEYEALIKVKEGERNDEAHGLQQGEGVLSDVGPRTR